jgi:hypothetical protein
MGADGRLGYCLNVHPGETLDEVVAALAGPVARVAELTGEPLGVGLYLAAEAAREVAASPAALERLRSALGAARATVFTANAFPYGGFHAETVKRAVYRPTWSEPSRLGYTVTVAHVLAALLPEGGHGSLSTAPVSYRELAAPEPALELAGDHLGIAAVALEKIARRTGRELALAIEPEPNATLESASELVAFLQDHVFSGEGRARLERELSLDAPRAEAVARRRIGACLDVCHHAVVFEPIEDALAAYSRAGVSVVKAQLSSALELSPRGNAAGVARLRAFAEPRYLHQTHWKKGAATGRVEDIPGAFLETGGLAPGFAEAETIRSHVHVPLAWAGDAEIGTTRSVLERALPAIARATSDLEVETYTWSVLPAATRARYGDDVAAMVAAELAWVRAQRARHRSVTD